MYRAEAVLNQSRIWQGSLSTLSPTCASSRSLLYCSSGWSSGFHKYVSIIPCSHYCDADDLSTWHREMRGALYITKCGALFRSQNVGRSSHHSGLNLGRTLPLTSMPPVGRKEYEDDRRW